MPTLDYSTLPTPRFAVLDVVRIRYDGSPGLSQDFGTVTQVRFYRERGYRYSVANNELGGILDDSMLAPTGQRDTVDSFWYPPLRKGDVVQISTEYPKAKWHGFVATVDHCYVGERDSYGVSIGVGPDKKTGGVATKYREIKSRYLIATGERIPPQPVPRPITTWASNGDNGYRPTHEFSIMDEIDQYL